MGIKNFSLYQFTKKNQITKSGFLLFFTVIFLSFYFLTNMIFGEKSLKKILILNQESSRLELEKAELQQKLAVKKQMIEGMDTKSLDLDLVDEQSRQVLGYVGKNEKVIFKEEN